MKAIRVKSRLHRSLALALACCGTAALAWAPGEAAAAVGFERRDFEVGDNPASVAVGDFNQDGERDLAVATTASGDVSVLLGSGAGGFAARTDVPAGTGLFAVAVGDFNRNGDPDLAVLNSSDDISVLLGAAGGSFGAATGFPGGVDPDAVAVGDFNDDSDPDLVVANRSEDEVSILLGAAGGSFGAPAGLSVGDSPRAVAVGDFNADSDPDLAVANSGSDDVTIRFGGAGASFSFPVRFDAGDGPRSLAVGNFNGDSRRDLAVANRESDDVTILLGRQLGSGFIQGGAFAAGRNPVAVAAGDFSGDNDADLAVVGGGEASILLGGMGGGFGARQGVSAGESPESLAVANLDGDFRPDIAIGNQDSASVSVLLNRRTAELSPSPASVTFPPTPLGVTSAAKQVALTNTGHEALVVDSATAAGDFSVAQETCTAGKLSAGENCNVFVRFTPTEPGARSGDLRVQSNASGGIQLIPLSGSGQATADTDAPTVAGLRLTNRRFRVGRRPTARVAPRRRPPAGTTLLYRLSEPARVHFHIDRALPGQRVKRRVRGRTRRLCARPRPELRRGRRCIRHRRVGTLTRRGSPGRNRLRFSGRIARRSLPPGRYRITLIAIDAAANRSQPQRRRFTVVSTRRGNR
jgi:hypothetical protein